MVKPLREARGVFSLKFLVSGFSFPDSDRCSWFPSSGSWFFVLSENV